MSKHQRWLVVAVDERQVRWHHFRRPEARHVPTHQKVTARVQALVADELAAVPDPEYPGAYTLVELADAGRAWLKAGETP